jgi:hypothetical protein
VKDDVTGYHYQGRSPVMGWFNAAGLKILDEGFRQEDGWWLPPFLLQRASQ